METLIQDIRYGFRMLIKNRSFTVIAILALALGIGANTAIFSVVNAVLLRPLAYQDPDRIMTVLHNGWNPVSPADFLDWRKQQEVFEAMSAAQYWQPNLSGGDHAEQIRGLQVTADLFQMLGASPLIGRTFQAGEDQPGSDHVALLSHSLWQRRFSGDQAIVGQPITLDGESYTVIGVMPQEFQFAPFWATKRELWVPLNLAPRADNRQGRSLRIFARLKQGVTREAAQAEMNTIVARLEAQYPASNTGLTVAVDPLHEKVVGKVRPALVVLFGAVSFVLLIACANVANLMMARATARQKEIAIKTALGASRARIIRQLLTESVLLALTGGVVGMLLAAWGVKGLVALSPTSLPRVETIGLDYQVLGFTLILSLLTGLIFGLAPAMQTAKIDLNETLKEGGRSSTEGKHRQRARRVLVVAEVALAVVLLIGGGLMIRSFMRLQAVDAGFNARNVLTLEVSVAGSRFKTGPQKSAFFEQLVERIETVPGVASASVINHLPLGGDTWTMGFTIEGRPAPEPGQTPGAIYRIVRPNYFQTMGTSLLQGRDFDGRDTATSPATVIINEALARRNWPGENPIGKRINVTDNGPNPREIIGVVRDTKQRNWTDDARPEMYLPHLQSAAPSYMTLVIRTAADPLKLTTAIQGEVWAIDKDLPVSQVRSMEQVTSEAIGEQRFNMLLLGLFSAVALILASVGIYGVMAYGVAQRTHEIGIRMALGARAADVLKMIIGQGIWLALIGVGIGLTAAFALTRVMSSLLYGVSVTDPLTFIAIPAILLTVALGACAVPARRATKVDPMIALRYE